MKQRHKTILTCLILALVLLTACIPGDGRATPNQPAGFLWGVWHGWIAPISLILSLFRDGVSIYETANTGFWYDFGFYIAIVSGFGSVSLFRRKRRPEKHVQVIEHRR